MPGEKEERAWRIPLEDTDKTSQMEDGKRGFPLARQPCRRKVSTGESPPPPDPHPENNANLSLLPRKSKPAEKTGKLVNIGRR